MTKKEQLRCVSWAAVSSRPQAKEVSNSEQCRINREHIERIGGVLIAELVVPGKSRSYVLYEDAAKNIEEYVILKDLIDRRAFDVLVFLDASRLGREDALISAVSGLCRNAGIRLYETSSPPATLDGPVWTLDSQLLGAIKGVQAHWEIHKLKERSTMGRRARIKKGKHAGTPPFGYERTHDKLGNVHIAIVEEEAKAVRLFYDLYVNAGLSLESIGKEFEKRGYTTKTGKTKWIAGTIRRFLVNRWTYAGYTSWGYRSERFAHEAFRAKGEWEPIIDEDTVRAAEEAMARRNHARRAIRGPHRYSMLGKCAYCGNTIAVHNRVGDTHTKCLVDNFLCTKLCRGTHISETKFTQALTAAIKRLADSAYVEQLVNEQPDHSQHLRDRQKDLSRNLDKVLEQRKQLTLVFTRGTITLDEYEDMMGSLQAQANELGKEIALLDEALAHTSSPQQRRDRLEEIREHGMAWLDHPDVGAANLWLRKCFQLSVGNYEVLAVNYLL